MYHYHVDVVNRRDIPNYGDYSFRIKTTAGEFVVDIKGKGMSQSDTFLASIGACVGVYIRKYIEATKLSLDDFSISVDADLNDEKPAHLNSIRVNVNLKGAQLDVHRKEAILNFLKDCPVSSTFSNSNLAIT